MWKKLALLSCCMSMSASYANVVILGTRVIYPADQKSVTVQLSNNNQKPALIQSWIDTGDQTASPDQIKAPFVITPPVVRVEPQSGQALRITYTGEALPQDRESVFYLNVLDVPPKPDTKTGTKNYLQIAIRSRLKLFFRPSGLTIPVTEAYEKVLWHTESQSGQTVLVAHNPTPYHVTYTDITVTQGSKTFTVQKTGMVAPMSDLRFALPKAQVGIPGKVKWSIINDYGGTQTSESYLQQ